MPPQSKSHTSLASRRSSVLNFHQPPAAPDVYYVGVDVGTGLARACIIDTNGAILGLSERPITRHELRANHITQLSTEIWNAICFCVRNCLRDLGVDPADVFGIGFDATCLLVAISELTDSPVGVGPDFMDNRENIILWMDHRAEEETNIINATGDKCLKYVGGQMSIEMELPKMKWLKHHLPHGLNDVKFYDLPDYLTHKATGLELRLFNSAVCKQGFVPLGVDNLTTGWSEEFLREVGVPELCEDNFRKLGGVPGVNGTYLSAGDIVGKLTPQAAEELGLTTECIVGSGVIDAYAGWVGTVAAKVDVPQLQELAELLPDGLIGTSCGRLAAVAGTLTCHIAMTRDPCFVQGVWGPYKDVMAPGYWLAEGGQLCTGALLAHVLAIHPATPELSRLLESSNLSKFDYLNLTLENMVAEDPEVRLVVSLARHMFFYGDFHGNRLPVADPRMRALIIGQLMDSSINDLAIQYFGACEFIAQQTRQIIEEMTKGGHRILCVFMSGGQCRNGLLMRLLADCTGLPIIIPRYIDAAVVFGLALLGAVALEDAVKERQLAKGRTRRSSILHSQKLLTSLQHEEPHSPYTAPLATALTTNMSALVYPTALHSFMTPMDEGTEENADYFNQPVAASRHQKAVSETDDLDDDGEQTLSFGSKNNVQKGLSQKLSKLGIKPLSAVEPKKESSNPGDKLWRIMERMTGPGKVILPSDEHHPDRKLLAAKYEIFLEQCTKQQEYRKLVDRVEADNKKSLKV